MTMALLGGQRLYKQGFLLGKHHQDAVPHRPTLVLHAQQQKQQQHNLSLGQQQQQQPLLRKPAPLAVAPAPATSVPRAAAAAAPAPSSVLPWQAAMSDVKKRRDLKKIMIIGAGPIIIGQACEFDYSGTQAVKALLKEGYEVVLINSNPATIMTDPGLAHRTFIGPMTVEYAEQIIAKERPDAILPTMGGQTALNLAKGLSEGGILEKYGVELIGAKLPSIDRAEDRELFKLAMGRIGLSVPKSGTAESMEQAMEVAAEIGRFPLIIRPAFTCGGTGGGIAYNVDEYKQIIKEGLDASMTNQVGVKLGCEPVSLCGLDVSMTKWVQSWSVTITTRITSKGVSLFALDASMTNQMCLKVVSLFGLGASVGHVAITAMVMCKVVSLFCHPTSRWKRCRLAVHQPSLACDSITVAPSQTLTDKEYQRLRDAAIAIIREMGVECGGSNVQMSINPADGDMIIIEMNPRVSRSSALASKATGFPIAKMAAKLSVGYTLDQIANDITQMTPASFEPSIDYVVTKVPRFNFEKFAGSKPELTTMMKSVGEVMAIGRTWQESMQKALRGMETGLDGWDLPKNYKRLSHQELLYNLRVPNPERTITLKQAFEDGLTVPELFQLTNIDPWWLEQHRELHDIGVWLRTKTFADLDAQDMQQLKRRGFSDAQLARLLGTTWQEVRRFRLSQGIVPSYKRIDTCAAEFAADTPYMYSCYDGACESNPLNTRKVLILGGGPNRIGQGIEFDYCCCHASFSLRSVKGLLLLFPDAGRHLIYYCCCRASFFLRCASDLQAYRGPAPVFLSHERPEGIIVQFGGQTPLKIATTLETYLNENKIPTASGNGFVKVWGTQPSSIDKAEDRDLWMELLYKLDIKQPSGESRRTPNVYTLHTLHIRMRRLTPGGSALVNALHTIQTQHVSTHCAGDSACVNTLHICLRTPHSICVNILQVILRDSACVIPPQTISKDVQDKIRTWVKAIAKELQMRSTGEVMGIDETFSGAYAKAQIAAGQKLPMSGSIFVSMADKYKLDIVPIARELADLGYKLVATSGTAKTLSENGVPCEVVYKIHEGRPNPTDLMRNGDIKMILMTNTNDDLDRTDGKELRRLALTLDIPTVTTINGAWCNKEALRHMRTDKLAMVAVQDYFPNYYDDSMDIILEGPQ
ncbi:hypothetical protein DUNSADRAFT_16196 [Dunaliella salina]|uniref:Carbamoyl-phosphate synthase (glutamine-hydrolyzing) n=1 Tax=Dunaliella salina TaxID=3046 RepID=A0ABQ7G421_DUNSA|nr:hypothetical protein DUNSADRAFT_16196 [Dunaliella salina]|eukprot:KAF5829351.1 hypothetical protein DUNSADRAFT_16196 [Dunaliella salina]